MKSYRLNINGKTYTVEIKELNSTKGIVNVNGADYEVELPPEHNRQCTAKSAPAAVAPTALPVVDSPKITSTAGAITSPLPGTILSIIVSKGQSVKRGEKLLVLEAMKMENEILATQDGTITQILVDKGDTVQEGQTLIIIS